ncbi:SSXT family protein [Perilla frutescens var. hirtella]|nr:SSXT family protein [Perilla frutescens var. hirtella]
MQQHLMQMQPMMAAYYPSNVTTDHIQQYLDENKSLILKIVESQNSGKLSECAENQARLQRNLMYLAAIADSQPQPPTMHSQYPHYLQQQQQMTTSQSVMAARSSMLYGAQPYPSLQQQALHNQLGLMLQGDPHSSSALGPGVFPDFRSKQDLGTNIASAEGRGATDGAQTSLYLKSAEDGN